MDQQPLISAIMLAGRMPQWQLQRAVDCFTAQTYPNTELVLVNNASSQLQASQLQLRLPASATVLDTPQPYTAGACRNAGILAARGAVLAQFDAHCWHAPQRLARQWAAMVAHRAHLCLLQSGLQYSYLSGYLGRWHNPKRCLLNSLMLLHPGEHRHQELDQCEELSLLQPLLGTGCKPIALGHPELLCRLHYGGRDCRVEPLSGVGRGTARRMRSLLRAQPLG